MCAMTQQGRPDSECAPGSPDLEGVSAGTHVPYVTLGKSLKTSSHQEGPLRTALVEGPLHADPD